MSRVIKRYFRYEDVDNEYVDIGLRTYFYSSNVVSFRVWR